METGNGKENQTEMMSGFRGLQARYVCYEIVMP